ncbi:NADase-type glycan-binding domain-containing protein [Streptomyces brasiliensis]|uniref:Zinc ribbon domain-containing protein n=1 Tax=Streptomyces brasiliensis TaxID=1954 RepID=A0A917P6S0_9ACTN|nr:zinc ribbon domain-containing protein [Streptomyces brasiliensis]GGJ64434.1 zinc ribbon domain-containing protein [Streptomyces brasiliensis]
MTTPLNCAECGTRAEPGQPFCDACGAVLSWTDRAGGGGGERGAGEPRAAADGAGGGPGSSSDTGSGDASPAFSAASPDEAAATVPAASGGSGSAGWDAFAGADGNAGMPRTQRDLLGARATTAATDPPAPEPAPAPAPEGTTRPEAPAPDASVHPPVPEPGASHHPTILAVDDTAPTEPIPVPVAATPFPTPPAPGADPDGVSDRARQLLVPVADPEPRPTASPSVAPVLPGRPAPQRPQAVMAPGEEFGADGGTPCPWCSTRNRPDRHFCTRCAMPLAGEARAPGRLPWWRRLLGAANRETPWAGERPRLRRAFDRVLTWLGAAIVVTLLIVLGFQIPKGTQATRDHFSKRASVEPDSWSASRAYPGHKADLADLADKLNNTWWGPGVSESGQGHWIQAKFDEPTRLLDLIITPGVSTRPDQIPQSARPHRLEAKITLSDGKTVNRRITLDPGAGGQRIPFRVGTVSSVRFTIESATGTSSKKQVAIAEIEFFGPSTANSA